MLLASPSFSHLGCECFFGLLHTHGHGIWMCVSEWCKRSSRVLLRSEQQRDLNHCATANRKENGHFPLFFFSCYISKSQGGETICADPHERNTFQTALTQTWCCPALVAIWQSLLQSVMTVLHVIVFFHFDPCRWEAWRPLSLAFQMTFKYLRGTARHSLLPQHLEHSWLPYSVSPM